MKKLRILIFGVAGLVTLVALAWAVENLRGQRAWANCQAELRAAGAPLELKELLPPMPPDDQNFAMIPLLKPLHDYAIDPVSHNVVWRDTNALKRAQTCFSWWIDRREIGPRWRVAEFVDWSGWQEGARSRTNSPDSKLKALLATPPASPEEDLMFLLDQTKAEMDEIREALKRPQSVFAVHYEESLSALLPELAVVKGFAQAFRAHAMARLRQGRPEEAFADVQAVLGLGDAVQSEPLLISQLVRMAIVELAMQPLWEGMARHQWTPEQLDQFQRRLLQLNLAADLRRSLQGERIEATLAVDYLRRHQREAMTGEDAPWLGWMPAGWYAQNKVTIAQSIEQLLLPAIDVAHRRFDLDLAQRKTLALERQLKPARPYTIVASMLVPALSGAVRKTARCQSTVDLAAAACALERFRLRQGKYPDRLEELVPTFLPAVPQDGVGQGPLRYQREGDQGFAVYGVGLNRTDEHGTPAQDKRGQPQPDKPEGDWVWRIASAPRQAK